MRINTIETLEIILVCIIVLIQLWVFCRTVIQINLFKSIIPEISTCYVTTANIPSNELIDLQPHEILENISHYIETDEKEKDDLPNANDEAKETLVNEEQNLLSNLNHILTANNLYDLTPLNIIESDSNSNRVFKKILFSINTYLIRNNKGASDFNLLKDIVERNTDAIEEDINLTVAVPLYLGLMGTMIGIVIGLFNMSDLTETVNGSLTDEKLGGGISVLLGGVKIAMVASFVGLLLTILTSGWIFKGSRILIESRKNDFYTFLQVELLPVLNQGLASTFESLQRNLLQFNNEFSTNLKGLTGIFNSNRDALFAQQNILNSLEKIPVTEITKYNVTVLKQLQNSVPQLERLNEYLTNINSFVSNSEELSKRAIQLLIRSDNFETIADSLSNTFSESHNLLLFLSKHFQSLDEQKQYVSNAVADVGHSITDTFKELKEHIQKSSDTVKQFTVDEIDALKTAMSESKTNLSNLHFLETLNKDLGVFKNDSASQGESLKQELQELNKNMVSSIDLLRQIEQKKGFITSFKRFFKSKKNQDVV